MSKYCTLPILLFFIFLSGCGTTGQVKTSYEVQDGDTFRYTFVNTEIVTTQALPIFEERLKNQLSDKGIYASPDDSGAKEINIQFNNYRMRHGAARALAGVFAGSDNIDTTVTITNGGNIVGEYEVVSSNASAWGTSQELIEGHIDKIVDYISKSTD